MSKDDEIARLEAKIAQLKRMLNPNSTDAAHYDLGRADGLRAQNMATAALKAENDRLTKELAEVKAEYDEHKEDSESAGWDRADHQ